MKIINIRENSLMQPALYPLYRNYLKKDESEVKDYIDQRASLDHCELFIFEDSSHYVGFAEACITQECFPDEDLPELCMKIVAFYIDPKVRRQHFGSCYMKELRNWAHEKEVAMIEIEVQPDNIIAAQFLDYMGFELVGSGKKCCYRSII